ncbi:MAG: hypothetical protein PGN13_13355 [Patulibacter minatonensis]
MPTPGSLLRASSSAPLNVRPQLGLRLQFAAGVVPYLRPTVEVRARGLI